MQVQVRVRPGALLTDNRTTYGPGDELAMEMAEANRRIKQGKVEMVGASVMVQLPEKLSGFAATEKIEAAQVAASIAALEELRVGEDRKTVLAAIEAREQELRK
jgi:hypothetical protein